MAKANEPAFPIGAMLEVPELSGHTLAGNDPRPATWTKPHPGLSKREWFAGMAMIGMLAYPGDKSGSWHDNSNPKDVSEMAYQYADAMIRKAQQ